jgi:hypothetical protein
MPLALCYRFGLQCIRVLGPLYFFSLLFASLTLLFFGLFWRQTYGHVDLSLYAEVELSAVMFFYDFCCDQPYSDC